MMEREPRKYSVKASPSLLFFASDMLIAVAAFYAAILVRFLFDFEAASVSVGSVFERLAVFTLATVVGLTSMGLYRARQRPLTWETVARVLVGVSIGGLTCILAFYFLPDLATGRGVLALSVLFAAAGLTVGRLLLMRFVDQGSMKRRVLVLGSGRKAASLSRLRRQADRRNFEIVGYVPVGNSDPAAALQSGLQPLVPIESVASRGDIDELVVAMDDRRGHLPLDLLIQEKFRGVVVTDIVDFLEDATGKIDLDVMAPAWLIFSDSGHTSRAFKSAKRLVDITLATVLLIFSAPVLILVAAGIKLEDGIGAPVLYRQRRVGLNHSVFWLLKFRSMTKDAEKNTGAQWSSGSADSRVTRVGRLIRRLRIDELPQLMNVLRGEMSIVGPRPERPEFVQQLSAKIPYYDYRHCLRPGLTGWAQLNFPYGASVDDARTKLKYDLYYIKKASVLLDLLILLQTLEIVVWGSATSMAGPSGPIASPDGNSTMNGGHDRRRAGDSERKSKDSKDSDAA
jgi:sugar transferase (PEP-CTERM system associated)